MDTSPPPSDLEQQSPPSVPVLEVPSPRRPRGIFSSPLYTAKDYFDRTAPTNVLKCLELDQLSLQRPLLYRKQYLNNGLATAGLMHTTDIRGHHGCVNAISFSNLGEEFLATGGDDERVLVWKVADAIEGKQLRPMTMATSHQSNVFSAVFSCDNSFIYSGGNDGDVVQHDFASGRMVNMYPHPDAVYSVAAHPLSPNIILTASEDGFVRIIDTRMPRLTLDMVLEGRLGQCAYQTVAINPVEPRLIAIGSTRNGTELYDTQERKRIIRYNPTRWIVSQEDVVSVCFNDSGTQLFTMLRQLPPCLYDIWNKEAKCLFIDNNGAYRNSVTMKSGCFLGLRDEYVVSGSDDFRIYIWKIPDGKPVGLIPVVQEVTPHLILPGHRSIVNQIRYSPTHHIMCSSGVEKVVKLWSHLPLFAKDEVQYSGHPPSRRKYTRLEFIRITIDEDEQGDGSADPLQEDQQVLAFFDSLVDQDDRDITNLMSSSSDDYSTSSSPSSDQSDSSPMAYSTHIHWIDLPSSSPWSAQSTPQSLSPANTSSLEPPWSDLEEREWWDSESSDHGGSGESDDDGDEKDGEFKRSENSSETCKKNGTESRISLEVLASSKGGAQAESRKRGASSQSKRSKKSGSKSYTKEFFLKTVPPSKFYSPHSTSHPGPSSGATCLASHPGPSATCLASHPGPSSGATCPASHPGPSSGATCPASHPGPSSGATCLNEDTRGQNHKAECSVSGQDEIVVDSRNVENLQENGKTSDSQDVDEDKLNSAHSTSIS